MRRQARRANSSPRSAPEVGHPSAAGPAPDRLIVVVDNLDALSPAEAVSWIDAAQGVIGPGFIGLLAFDPEPARGGARGPKRGAPAPWQMAASRGQPAGPQGRRRRAVVARLLSAGEQPAPAPDSAIAASACGAAVERGNGAASALAPLAAHSPRDAKRFLNAYRLARCSTRHGRSSALMQAVAFADDDAQTAMLERSPMDRANSGFNGPPALVEAVKAARVANNGPISIEEARAAAETALATPCRSKGRSRSLGRAGFGAEPWRR